MFLDASLTPSSSFSYDGVCDARRVRPSSDASLVSQEQSPERD